MRRTAGLDHGANRKGLQFSASPCPATAILAAQAFIQSTTALQLVRSDVRRLHHSMTIATAVAAEFRFSQIGIQTAESDLNPSNRRKSSCGIWAIPSSSLRTSLVRISAASPIHSSNRSSEDPVHSNQRGGAQKLAAHPHPHVSFPLPCANGTAGFFICLKRLRLLPIGGQPPLLHFSCSVSKTAIC